MPRHAAETGEDWLRPPLLPASVAPLVAAAAALPYPLYLVGETGTGRRAIALAVARRAGAHNVRIWAGGPPPEIGPDDALLVVDFESWDDADRARLEELVDRGACRLLLASSRDPEPLVAEGRISRRLYHRLAPLALRLPPLRERRADIEPLAELFAARAGALLDAEIGIGEDAADLLQGYAWPGNLAELEAVVARSVALAAPRRPRALAAADIVLAAPLAAPEPSAPGSPRRTVVVPLARAEAEPSAPPAKAGADVDAEPSALEHLVAGLAHDLRNPMATVKTFASLSAADAADDDTRALAAHAAEACARMDHHLDLLHAYAALQAPAATAIDVVALLAAALADRDDAAAPTLATGERTLTATTDPQHARFVVEALLDELREVGAAAVPVALDVEEGALTLTLETEAAAATHLARLVPGGDAALPWRLELARAAARRGGGELSAFRHRDTLSIRWRPGAAVEETDDGQARSPDRRRRTRRS